MQSAAAALPPLQAAAHQALWSVWNLCAFSMGPVEQAFYSFIPGVRSGKEEAITTQILIAIGLGLGLVSSMVRRWPCRPMCVACMTGRSVQVCSLYGALGVRLLTPDATIWPLVGSMTPLAVLALVGCSMDVSGAGMLLAKDKIGAVVRNFAIVFFAVAAFVHTGKAQVGA